jgi:hypothetical protein
MTRFITLLLFLASTRSGAVEPQVYWLIGADYSTADLPTRPLPKEFIQHLTKAQARLATDGAMLTAWCTLFEAGGGSKAGQICDLMHRAIDIDLGSRRDLFDFLVKATGRGQLNVCEALIIDKDSLMASAKMLRAEADKDTNGNELLIAIAVRFREEARKNEADADKFVTKFRQGPCEELIAKLYYPKPSQ